MKITLHKAVLSDCTELYNLQIESFKQLLEKYKDYNFSPGAEKMEKTIQRLQEDFTDYYFICLGEKHIGAVRIFKCHALCKLKQIYILPEFQGNGYAQQAITLVELINPDATHWELDTIKQETKLCHLYEKMGYVRTGKEESIKENMTLVFYAK